MFNCGLESLVLVDIIKATSNLQLRNDSFTTKAVPINIPELDMYRDISEEIARIDGKGFITNIYLQVQLTSSSSSSHSEELYLSLNTKEYDELWRGEAVLIEGGPAETFRFSSLVRFDDYFSVKAYGSSASSHFYVKFTGVIWYITLD